MAEKKEVNKKTDEKWFTRGVIVALYRINIENCDEKVTKTSQFKDQYNWSNTELPVALARLKSLRRTALIL